MYLSLNWLRELTPYDGSSEELAKALTMLGLEVEEQFEPFGHLEPVLVGSIHECSPHPDADSLSLCRVDLGEEALRPIVCGAPNCAEGQLVPVALPGTELPSGQQMQKCSVRGQTSEGMILSEKELGLGEDHSGIMVLESLARPGTPLPQALGLRDRILDIDITPNRGDCLSVLGVAREVASYFGLPLHPPRTEPREEDEECAGRIEVRIQDSSACPLYQLRLAEGVVPDRSPDWLRYRLLALGHRPINTVVDITNYVMLETGQPLHAFDLDLMRGDRVEVARAGDRQEFTTLDGSNLSLEPQDLLIRDAERPVALAGIMGGQNTEVGSGTRRLLLECAVFDPTTIRKTARRLALSSESSYRFERGVDQPESRMALDRAAGLIQELAGGRVLRGVSYSEPRPWQPVSISFRPERARSLLAMEANDEFCSKTLRSLGCSISREDGSLEVTPPSHRQDLTREVDLIEEVARFYGFENTPRELPRVAKPLSQDEGSEESADHEFQKTVRQWAKGLGLQEVVNYSFVSSADLDALGLPRKTRLELQNPLTSEQDTMRPHLAPGMLLSLRSNLDRNTEDLRLFEISRNFYRDPRQETLCREKTLLGLVLHGSRHPRTWPWPQETADFLDLKGLLENLLSCLHLGAAEYVQHNEHPYLDPCAEIRLNQQSLGTAGRLASGLSRRYHARHPVWIAELDLDLLQQLHREVEVAYSPWSRFPPVFRDMTLVKGPELSFESVRQQIRAASIEYLDTYMLLDVYQPPESHNHNITLRLVYRHPERTLTDREVDQHHQALGEHLLRTLPVRFP